MDLSDIEISFDYGESGSEAERLEIIRNVRTILLTPAGTCPLYRDFGLDMSWLDRPLDQAQNLCALAAMEAVEHWEPRIQVTRVSFDAEPADGHLKARVVIAWTTS